MDNKEYSLIFKALGDETRLKIFNQIKEGERICACKILRQHNITQPTLSFHIRKLVECKLVKVEKQGVWNFYSIDKQLLSQIKEVL